MIRTLLVACVLACVALPARAQDAGEGEAADPNAATCDGDVLHFTDSQTGEAQTIDCAAKLSATCGTIAGWGADCVLPDGADCDPGYAGGKTRCTGSFCVGHKCTQTAGSDPAPTPTEFGEDALTLSTSCLGCPASGTGSPAAFLQVVFGLWGLRRLQHRKRSTPTSRS
jgi:hypothetical protein